MSSGAVQQQLQAVCQVCKTWFESQRTHYCKLTQSKSGQAPKEMMERQNWIQDKFNFLKIHIRCKGLSKSSGFKSRPEEPVHPIPQHTTSPALQPTWIVRRSACGQIPQYSLQLQVPVQFLLSLVDQQVMVQFLYRWKPWYHNFIISWVKARDNKNSLLQLPGIWGGGLRRFRNEAVKLPSSIQSRAQERSSTPATTAIDIF